ncbi:methyltransferase domain-containing protein [bacterium]|jgi:hypothetical protein|nr:methyltransferase domain-containing protein [bacterium]
MRKLKKHINRKKSVVTGKQNLKLLHTFHNYPVYFGCINNPSSEDIFTDMEWWIDKNSGVIQLNKLIPLDILYQEQHVDGVGPSWENYYQDLASFVIKQNPKDILEIGGGSGRLANIILDKTPNLPYTMIEPNPKEKNSNINIIVDFFDKDFILPKKADTIIFSQVLEHAYSPEGFIKGISNNLNLGGKVIFGYPDLKYMLKNKQTNAINFEHTMFLTDYFVDFLLKKHNLEIIKKKRQGKVNILYFCQKKRKVIQKPLKNKYSEYKKIFDNFIDHHKKIVLDLNKKIQQTSLPVYLFGAHIFSQHLIALGLKTDKIINILDNGESKQNRRLYGTNLISKSPKILKGIGKGIVILKAGSYNDEIKQDILENINSNIIFI